MKLTVFELEALLENARKQGAEERSLRNSPTLQSKYNELLDTVAQLTQDVTKMSKTRRFMENEDEQL